MTVVIAFMLVLTAAMGTAVVLSGRPERQALTLSAYGLTLAVLFMALQAPDVALSQIGVGTAIVPLMVMLTFRKVQQGK
jgi:uncharacterized MnhB-related membrane protein